MIADHYSDAFLNGDMTDEDRQKLIARLRDDAPDWTTSGQRVRMLCDEIERLAEENSQLKDRIELLEHEMKYGTDD